MRPWKKESRIPALDGGLERDVIRQEERKLPSVHYKVFTCEMSQLEAELNARDPEGKAEVFDIAHRGSACDVVIRL